MGPTKRSPAERQTSISSDCRCAPSGSGLREARRDHDQRAHPLVDAIPSNLEHERRGHRHEGEVDGARNIQDRGVCGHALHGGGVRIHGVDHPVERFGKKVPQESSSDRGRIARGADDRDRCRIEKGSYGAGGGQPLARFILLDRVRTGRGEHVDAHGARLRVHGDGEPGLAEDLQHRVVLG